MRILDYLKLAKTNLKRNTKLFWRNATLISLSITILLASYITASSMNNALDRLIRDNITFRTLYVNKKDYSEISADEIEKVNHVDKVINQNNFKINIDIVKINNEKTDGSINLIGSNEKISPPIIKGRNIYEDENDECILPQKFYIGNIREKLNNNEIIDGEKLLGKEIEVSYYTYKYIEGDSETLKKQEHIKKMTVVGIYDTEDTMGDYNECYVSYDLMEDINNTISYGTNSGGNSPVLAIIDNSENIDKVIHELSELNYDAFQYSEPKYTYIYVIDWTGKIIGISIIILVLINMTVNSVKNSQDRKKNMVC